MPFHELDHQICFLFLMKSDSGKIVFPDPGQQLHRTRAFADFDDEDPDAVEKSVPAPKFTFLGSKVLFFLCTPLFFPQPRLMRHRDRAPGWQGRTLAATDKKLESIGRNWYMPSLTPLFWAITPSGYQYRSSQSFQSSYNWQNLGQNIWFVKHFKIRKCHFFLFA